MDMEENEEIPIGDEPELEAIQQVEVPFLDAFIMALLGNDGDIYVPVAPFAGQLGIVNSRNQVARIKKDDTMSEGLRRMPVESAGGIQRMQCIRLDMFTIWLITITEKMCKEEIRPTLSRYKRQAARAILRHFQEQSLIRTNGSNLPALAPDASLEEKAVYHRALADLYEDQARQKAQLADHERRLGRAENDIADMQDSLTGVKETLLIMGEMVREVRISPHEANQIHALVSQIHAATGLKQATIFAAFKKEWKIPRYDELPAAKFDRAYEWLRQWGYSQLKPGRTATF
jgi:P22_AR N-terminal domain